MSTVDNIFDVQIKDQEGFIGSLKLPKVRPHRSSHVFYTRYLNTLLRALAGLLMVLETPSLYTAATVIFYCSIYLLWMRKGVDKLLLAIQNNNLINIGRAEIYTIGITLYFIGLNLLTGYKDFMSTSNLWLIYLIPIFLATQSISTGFIAVVFLSCCISVFGLEFLAALPTGINSLSDFWFILVDSATKILYLSIPTLIFYVLLRTIMDLTSDLNFISDVTNKTALEGVDDERRLLQMVVDRLEKEFGFTYVNAFVPKTRDELVCVAGTGESGSKLINYVVKRGEGLVGTAAATGEIIIEPDLVKNPNPAFKEHDAFKDTKAELVIPVNSGQKNLVILDIQMNRPKTLLERDRVFIQLIGRYLSNLLVDIQKKEVNSRFNKVVELLTVKFFSQDNLYQTLQAIVEAATEEFDVDVAVIYAYDEATKSITEAAMTGHLEEEQQITDKAAYPNGLVLRLMNEGVNYFQNYKELEKSKDLPVFQSKSKGESFIQREHIKSRAIIPLKGESHLGILFLNFRRNHDFTTDEKERMKMLANLGTVAIQKTQQYKTLIVQQKEESEQKLVGLRQEFLRELHDSYWGAADGVDRLIKTGLRNLKEITQDKNVVEDAIRFFRAAQIINQKLKRDLRFSHDTLKNLSSGSPIKDLVLIAELTRYIYKIDCTLDLSKASKLEPQVSPEINEHIRQIVIETIRNAVRHGEATSIEIKIELVENKLVIDIRDDGIGFQVEETKKQGGLGYINQRISLIGATYNITSVLQEGTTVQISIPVSSLQQGEE